MAKVENIQSTKASSKLASLVIAGIVATVAFNVVMYADMAITGIPVDIVTTMGQLIVAENEFTQSVGYIIHFADGIGLALLFGYVVVPISRKITRAPIVVVALVYAVIELVIAVWLGMLPALGAGIAGVNIAPEVAVMTLFRHLAFGLVLGITLKGKI